MRCHAMQLNSWYQLQPHPARHQPRAHPLNHRIRMQPGAPDRTPQRQRVVPVEGLPREAGRHVRVHPLRVLLHLVPLLLVEPGQVPRARGAAGGVQVRARGAWLLLHCFTLLCFASFSCALLCVPVGSVGCCGTAQQQHGSSQLISPTPRNWPQPRLTTNTTHP